MEMIAMLGGLGQADAPMTEEERLAVAARNAAVARVQEEQRAEILAFWKMLGVFAAGTVVGWVVRGQVDRGN